MCLTLYVRNNNWLVSIFRTQVRLGEHDLNTERDCQPDTGCAPPVQNFGIDEAMAHPNYLRSDVRNDIGLIRLDRNAMLTDCE